VVDERTRDLLRRPYPLVCSTGPYLASVSCRATSDETWQRVLQARDATGDAAPERYFASWHADNGGSSGEHNLHRIWVLLHKSGDGAARGLSNLCVVPTSAVDRCDTPRLRIAGHAGRLGPLFERFKCCPSLDPGDAIFYREDVMHRTQGAAQADRLGMILSVETERPALPTPEDVRCAEWADEGACTANGGDVPIREYMSCTCQRACEKAAATLAAAGSDGLSQRWAAASRDPNGFLSTDTPGDTPSTVASESSAASHVSHRGRGIHHETEGRGAASSAPKSEL